MNKKELRTELWTQTKLWMQWMEIKSWKQIEKSLIWILAFHYSRQSGESVKLIEKLLKWQLRGDCESDNSDWDYQTVLKEDDHKYMRIFKIKTAGWDDFCCHWSSVLSVETSVDVVIMFYICKVSICSMICLYQRFRDHQYLGNLLVSQWTGAGECCVLLWRSLR